MAIDIYQFGGYTGSYAGDCSVIGANGHFLMIDLGRNSAKTPLRPRGTQSEKGFGKVAGANGLNVVVTHFHADHINDGNSWQSLANLGARIHYGAPATPSGTTAEQAMLNAIGAGATQYSPAQNGQRIVAQNIGGWTLEAYVIVPNFVNVNAPEENDASLGVLIELNAPNHNPVSILTLGDMSPAAGDTPVAAVLNQRGYGPNRHVTSVKLSHHGSANNFLPALNNVIGQNTTVLISGYTLTETRLLIQMLGQWRPKQTFMLFDPAGKSDFDANFYKGSELLRGLERAGVQFVEDFHVTLP